ncbi:MAG TPA: DUF5678 domain-containing protein [Candidatus Nanoarchaeia archaeon]|nr:DUF5678 domain-containing protein [Candidatus Nanoarchaeia archaeon]
MAINQEQNYQYYMEADMSRYIGEWVAIIDNKIIAHGKNVKTVAEQARLLSSGKKFLLARVPDKEAMIF